MKTNKDFRRIGIDARLWNQTGVGRYIQELIKNLGEIDTGNQYVIFTDENITNQLPVANYRQKIVDIRWHSLREQIVMPWIIWREHLDLVHFPYFSIPILYPGKFIVTIHDLILDHFDTGEASTLPWIIYKTKRLGYKLVMWVALRRAVKVITVSETTKQEIIDHYKINPEKIAVTYEAA
ncbi:MAG: glycosyltransferase [Candidatus Gottesmanbacteria bacterium]